MTPAKRRAAAGSKTKAGTARAKAAGGATTRAKAAKSKAGGEKPASRKATRKKKTGTRAKTTRKETSRKSASKVASSARASRTKKKAARRRPSVKREVALAIIESLAEHDPHPRCALDHANPFELLVATILSAQCTDARVNMVTPGLFARWPTPGELAAAEQEDLEEVIRSTGFFRNKAKNLLGMARRLVEEFEGEVPRAMDDLLSLPGVARKTANVVRGECFGLADGVVVDTHVNRITKRFGFTRESDPVKVERDLMRIVPEDHWIAFSHRVIRLGRTLCPARKPRCDECYLATLCPRRGV